MLFPAFVLALLAAAPDAAAQVPLDGGFGIAGGSSPERLGGAFGLGAGLGTPSGLAGKVWFGDTNALQFAAGGAWGRFRDFAGSVDFVVHFRPINVEGDDFSLPIHVGGGVKADVDLSVPGGQLLVGPRVVVGASVLVPTLPVDLFLEIAPTAYVASLWGWAMDGQVGVRYYF